MSPPIPSKLLDEAISLHGHLGAFLLLGLKAGLYANKILGRNSFRMRAIVETEPFPPLSCFVDGVQVATGCTMGKRNIELRKGRSLSVTFTRNGERIRLCLKNGLLKSLREISSKEESENMAMTLADRPIQDLFIVEE
ncbi:MAG: formylmethanofuran dehydrogenase subunit E family protein [Candidatus Thorarchaeota archaeon]|nr:MAG: formylmethanofuran dehydrogenase subunit E family protein [Candidatus Thorarchaeota archaeon]